MYHAKQKHLASGGSDAHIYVFNPQNAFDLEHKIKTEYGGIFSSCMFGMNHALGSINVAPLMFGMLQVRVSISC